MKLLQVTEESVPVNWLGIPYEDGSFEPSGGKRRGIELGAADLMDSADIVYVGNDFADEYSGSQDTARLKGALAKAKANAAQGIPELIETAENQRHKDNLNPKHQREAKFGWYRYDSRFGLPVYGEDGELERYNILKKETGIPLEQ